VEQWRDSPSIKDNQKSNSTTRSKGVFFFENSCNKAVEYDELMTFDPNFELAKMTNGFRIFAFEEALNEIPARRYQILEESPNIMTVFLYAHIIHPGQIDTAIQIWIMRESNGTQESESLSVTFDHPDVPLTALLGGLLNILQKTPKNVPLLICSSSDFLSRALVKQRGVFENNLLDPNFRLLRAVIAELNEGVAKIQFSKVSDNHARFLTKIRPRAVEIDTNIDIMFECPGILLSHGSQKIFYKILRSLRPRTHRKSTFINLDRIRCSIQEISKYMPTDETLEINPFSNVSTLDQGITAFRPPCRHRYARS
jgi:hypothetical protein